MTQLEIQQAAEYIDGLYQDVESEILQNIVRHIKIYNQPIPTDEWLLRCLGDIGKLNNENMAVIAKNAGVSQTSVERMLSDIAQNAAEELEPAMRYMSKNGLAGEAVAIDKSKELKRVTSSLVGQAKDSLNLCNTTMLYKARDVYKKLVQDTAAKAVEIEGKQWFLDELNKAALSVSIGEKSRQAALIDTIKSMNNRGIPAFIDKRGREWTPEAYVNMSIRATTKNVATESMFARMKDYDTDLMAVTSHSGARPKCAKDQGKIFSMSGKSGYIEDLNGKKIRYYSIKDSSYGQPDGLFGINCGHRGSPFAPGINIQRYLPTQDMDENNKLYEARQEQRKLERDVREQKRLCSLYQEIGDKEAFEDAAVKLKSKEAMLKNYVDSSPDLHRRKNREQVVGFDSWTSAESVRYAQNHYKKWAKSIGLESGPKRLAGYYDLKYNDSKESRLYKGYIDAVNNGRISPLVKFDMFMKVDSDISKELEGLVTSTNMEIKGHTSHFVDRIIGTHVELNDTDNKELKKRLSHAAVSIDEAKQAITKGEAGKVIIDGKGRKSQRFTGKDCIVTINPDTQELIQTNRKR